MNSKKNDPRHGVALTCLEWPSSNFADKHCMRWCLYVMPVKCRHEKKMKGCMNFLTCDNKIHFFYFSLVTLMKLSISKKIVIQYIQYLLNTNKTWACTVAMGHVHQIQDPITGIYEICYCWIYSFSWTGKEKGKIRKHNQVRKKTRKK